MADFVFNGALGRMGEWADNVETNDPAASVLQVHAWVSTAADDDVNNARFVSSIEATTNVTEATNAGYVNKELTPTELIITINDTTNLIDVDTSDIVWTGVSAGSNWTDISFSYDRLGTNVDSGVDAGTWHDFVVTPNGGDITAQIGANGFYRAS